MTSYDSKDDLDVENGNTGGSLFFVNRTKRHERSNSLSPMAPNKIKKHMAQLLYKCEEELEEKKKDLEKALVYGKALSKRNLKYKEELFETKNRCFEVEGKLSESRRINEELEHKLSEYKIKSNFHVLKIGTLEEVQEKLNQKERELEKVLGSNKVLRKEIRVHNTSMKEVIEKKNELENQVKDLNLTKDNKLELLTKYQNQFKSEKEDLEKTIDLLKQQLNDVRDMAKREESKSSSTLQRLVSENDVLKKEIVTLKKTSDGTVSEGKKKKKKKMKLKLREIRTELQEIKDMKFLIKQSVNELFDLNNDITIMKGKIENEIEKVVGDSRKRRVKVVVSPEKKVEKIQVVPRKKEVLEYLKKIPANMAYGDFLKIVIIGDKNVGKTSVLHRFIFNKFSQKVKDTAVFQGFLMKYLPKSSQKINPIAPPGDIFFRLFDTAGEEKYSSVSEQYFRNAKGLIVTFDINNKKSFGHVKKWISHASKYVDHGCAIMLLGNKSDLKKKNIVSDDQIMDMIKVYAPYNTIMFYKCSAKENHNIKKPICSFIEVVEYKFSGKYKKKLNTIKLEEEKFGKKKKACCKSNS